MAVSWVQTNSSEVPEGFTRINEAYAVFDIWSTGRNSLVFSPGGSISDPRSSDDQGFLVIDLDSSMHISVSEYAVPEGYLAGWVNEMLVGDFGADGSSIIFIDHGREVGSDYTTWENAYLWRMDRVDGEWVIQDFAEDLGPQFWHSSSNPMDINSDGQLDFVVSALSSTTLNAFLSDSATGNYTAINLKSNLDLVYSGTSALIELADGTYGVISFPYSMNGFNDLEQLSVSGSVMSLSKDGLSVLDKQTLLLPDVLDPLSGMDIYDGFSDILVDDFNKDGLSDFIAVAESNGGPVDGAKTVKLQLYLQNQNSQFELANDDMQLNITYRLPSSQFNIDGTDTQIDRIRLTSPVLLDADGDGLNDVLIPTYNVNPETVQDRGIVVGLKAGGTGFEQLSIPNDSVVSQEGYNPENWVYTYATELNNDDLADFVIFDRSFFVHPITEDNPYGIGLSVSLLLSNEEPALQPQDLVIDTQLTTRFVGSNFADQVSVLGEHPRNIHTFDGDDTLKLETINGFQINGGAGLDKIVVSETLSEYRTFLSEGPLLIDDIERLQFTDGSLALDLDGNAGTVAKILGAVFGADEVSNKEYAGIGLSYLDSGDWNFETLGALAMGVLAPVDNTEICEILWENVAGSPAEVSDIAPFVSMLDNEELSVGELVVLAANTAQNLENIDFVGLQSTGLEYIPVG